ncbi:MAG TPA: hypothetical protein VLE02_05170 [Nitrosarchaeum sp.]|nr:hypothetical protein [Nitrosarchaeum sp.]
MTIKVCINQHRFTQGIFYGLWTLATFGILLLVIASSYEIQSLYGGEDTYTNYCYFMYTSFFSHEEKCAGDIFDKSKEALVPQSHYKVGLGFTVIDFGLIGFWIYHKQNKIKIGLCEKTGVTKI